MTPGQAAFEAFQREQRYQHGADERTWSQLSVTTRNEWELAAEAAIKAAQIAPPKEIVPKLYVDTILSGQKLQIDPNQRIAKLDLGLHVVLVDPLRGSNLQHLNDVIQAANKGFTLRLAAVTNGQARSEFSRMNKDGTVRELLDVEGTW